MKPGLPANISGTGGVSAGDIAGLGERGIVDWAEMQLPRLLRPADEALRAEIRAAASRMRLPVSLHTETATFAANADPGVREGLAETLRDTVRLAGEVGAAIVTVHPPLANPAGIDAMTGGRWAPDEEALLRDATGDQDQAEEWFAEMLAAVLPDAGSAGAVLAIENMRARGPVPRLNRVETIAGLVRRIGRPELRICLDVRKAHQQRIDPVGFIEANAGWIANVHVAGLSDLGKPAAMPEGGIDWLNVMSALRATDYRGPLIYEGPPETAEASLEALRTVIS